MKDYNVIIEEVLVKSVKIKASNKKQAERIVNEKYEKQEIYFSDDDNVVFSITEIKPWK